MFAPRCSSESWESFVATFGLQSLYYHRSLMSCNFSYVVAAVLGLWMSALLKVSVGLKAWMRGMEIAQVNLCYQINNGSFWSRDSFLTFINSFFIIWIKNCPNTSKRNYFLVFLVMKLCHLGKSKRKRLRLILIYI
jgi:hypothetical protein